MAFFKGAVDEEVTFAPEKSGGGVSSLFRPLARFANKVQNRQFEQQLVFNLKKALPGGRPPEESVLADVEAEAQSADWWSSGGKQAYVPEVEFARSSSEDEDAIAHSEKAYSDDENGILLEFGDEGDFEEARPEEIVHATRPRPSVRQGDTVAPQEVGASASAAAADRGAPRERGKQNGPAKTEKGTSSESKSKQVVKSVGDKTGEVDTKAGRSKPEGAEKKDKKEKKDKEKKDKKEKRDVGKAEEKVGLQESGQTSKGHRSSRRGSRLLPGRAKDPFADSGSDDPSREALVKSTTPTAKREAFDPFADSDSDHGTQSKDQRNAVQATKIGRQQLPSTAASSSASGAASSSKGGMKNKPAAAAYDPFADSDEDEIKVTAPRSGPGGRSSLVPGALKGQKSAQKAAAPATLGQQHWPAAADSDSGEGF